MLAFAVRGLVLFGVLSWYSATVWRMIDDYFKDQFQTYLQEEYRKYPRLRSENVGAVDKESATSSFLPTESSRAEIYAPDAGVCSADTADTCPRAAEATVAAGGATGGGSENAATGSTDKNAFPKTRSLLESSELPGGSDTRDEERRSTSINQGDEEEEAAATGSSASPPRPARRRRHDRRRRQGVSAESAREKATKKRVDTIVLTDADFAGTRTGGDYNDFSEFEEDVDEGSRRMVSSEGILVSELPFKPKADIGGLDRVSAEEFCPLTLEDDASCGEITTWP